MYDENLETLYAWETSISEVVGGNDQNSQYIPLKFRLGVTAAQMEWMTGRNPSGDKSSKSK